MKQQETFIAFHVYVFNMTNYSMSSMARPHEVLVVDVCSTGAGTKGFSANDLTANNTTAAATARPIPTPHPGPVPSERPPELPSVDVFGASACSSLFSLKTAVFAAANLAVSISSFCRRTAAPLRPASCFLGSFTFAVVVCRSEGTTNCFASSGWSLSAIVVISTGSAVFNMTPVTMLSCG